VNNELLSPSPAKRDAYPISHGLELCRLSASSIAFSSTAVRTPTQCRRSSELTQVFVAIQPGLASHNQRLGQDRNHFRGLCSDETLSERLG